MHAIAEKIKSACPEGFVGVKEAFGELTVEVVRDQIMDVCRLVREDPSLDFDMLTDLCSVDFPNEAPRFEVIYQLYSLERNHRLRLKARVPEEDCHIDSVVSLWRSANFMEREVFDMMGISFNHHPDLRRILMTEDYDEGYPLRKDFPVEGRGWRDDFENLSEDAG
ncbi:MAG: NADH-quinone oxidoreductase subunit C [Nitrospiria bacterium]